MSSTLAAQMYDSSGLGSTVTNMVIALNIGDNIPDTKLLDCTCNSRGYRAAARPAWGSRAGARDWTPPLPPAGCWPLAAPHWGQDPAADTWHHHDQDILMSSSLIPDVVEDKVRKRCRVRNLLVGQGQTRGGREEAGPEPEEAEERLDRLLDGLWVLIENLQRLCEVRRLWRTRLGHLGRPPVFWPVWLKQQRRGWVLRQSRFTRSLSSLILWMWMRYWPPTSETLELSRELSHFSISRFICIFRLKESPLFLWFCAPAMSLSEWVLPLRLSILSMAPLLSRWLWWHSSLSMYLARGKLEGGRNWLWQKIEVSNLGWREQNTDHASCIIQ